VGHTCKGRLYIDGDLNLLGLVTYNHVTYKKYERELVMNKMKERAKKTTEIGRNIILKVLETESKEIGTLYTVIYYRNELIRLRKVNEFRIIRDPIYLIKSQEQRRI
jgi:hypothetical protein